MGSRKHGTSGHAPHSPRFRFMRQLEVSREQTPKPRAKLIHRTVSDAVKAGGTAPPAPVERTLR
jgi:hypothetical protein